MKFNPFRFKYARIVYGSIFLLLGGVFALFPMIPLGYAFLFASFILLAKKVPALNKWIRWLKIKDKSGRLKMVEGKLNNFFGEEEEEVV
tara:strand:+ start:2168 stop:2434 length:267 start_codon:yes stop_codon:yes gene_type:complete